MITERFRLILFLALVICALGFCLAMVFPFLRLIGWAVVLAVVAHPLYRRVAMGIRQPSVAAALVCLVVVLAIMMPITLVATELVNEAAALTKYIQSAQEQGDLARWLRSLEIPAVDAARRWLEQRIDLPQLDLASGILQTVGQVSSLLAKQSMSIVRNIIWWFIQLAMTLITLFFLLRDSPRLLPAVRAFLPLNGAQTDALLARVTGTIHAVVYGATVVAVTQGTLGGLAFWALGLPSPLLWGVVMIVLCLIPLMGAPVVWIPTVIILTVQGAYGKAILLALWGLLVIGLVDNFLRPIVIGARTRLHPLAVFFSVLGGLMLVGPLGLFLGPVVLTTTLALLDLLRLLLTEDHAPDESSIFSELYNEPVSPAAGSLPE